MTIKEKIKEAGRYEEVMEIINKILMECVGDNDTYPISLTSKGRKLNDVTDVEDIVRGIKLWMKYIEIEETQENMEAIKDEAQLLNELMLVIDSDLDMKLHNFGVDISHRKDVDESELETARAYGVLWSSINYFMYFGLDEDFSFIPFEVPKGWKKIKEKGE